MVSGTNFPGGDPFLQRQNEPSIAVSTRNPLHMFGGANDYRTVDIPGLGGEVTGDAWLGVFKSFDGGVTWQSTLLPGFPQDASAQGHQSPLFGLAAAADPVVRAGTNGLFYMSGIAFNREGPADGKIFVARYIDNNNLEKGDSIQYLSTKVIDTGNPVRFIDKPWIATDIPRAGAPTCTIPGQAKPIPAGTLYVVYSVFIQKNQNQANGQAKQNDPDWPGGGSHREMENGENHLPGVAMEGRTQIMIARSTDCGATFSNPAVVSDNQTINQGSIVTIDPVSGAVYVAWRVFKSSAEVDSIMVAKSTDGGKHFDNPVRVADISPFDQKGTTTTFRTNSYPAMAIDGTGRVYIAWAQRGIGPANPGQPGDARIVVSTSATGSTWSAPVPAMGTTDPYDTTRNPAKRGHQFMPVMNFGGGKLHLVWWDQRDDVAGNGYWGQYIDDYAAVTYSGPPQAANKPKRHTIDLRAAAAYPGATLQWGPSAKISNYLHGVPAGKTVSEQLQFNAPNLPLFALGTRPFIGDYLDVTVSPTFISNGDGSWRFNTLPSDPAVYYTAWGDNRDVRKPAARTPQGREDWVHYTPPQFAGYTGTSIFDPTQPVAVCEPGNAGMRDQNVYSTRVSTGLLLTTLGTQKPLGYVTVNGQQRLIQRSFVVTVTNPDAAPLLRSLVLHIAQQPVGGRASFLQFEQKIDLPVQVAARSSISREVFVTSTDKYASVPITVTEGSSPATSAKLVLNPDVTNPDLENPDVENPDQENPDIENAEAHAITVSNPDVENPDIENISKANPDIENPDLENPDLENPDVTNPDIVNPDLENPDLENPDLENPDLENPDLENPDLENAALTDVTWNVKNVGNTATSYQVKLLLKQAQQQRLMTAGVRFQLIVTKTTAAPVIDKCAVKQPNRNYTVVNITSPPFVDPTNSQQFATVINPDIENPDIENATVALAPGDTARVTLRIYSPDGDTTTNPTPAPTPDPFQDLTGSLTDLKTLGVVTTSHPVDTIAVQQGSTTPTVTASVPVILTTTLPDGARTIPYAATLEQTGAAEPFTFAVTTGSLPPGVTLTPAGAFTGAPTSAGVFSFTVALTDAQENAATATLMIRVFEPVVVGGGSIADGIVNNSYSTFLTASGGFPPYSWAFSGGSLPSGLSLAPSGLLAGTPTESGVFSFNAAATDGATPARTSTGAFVLEVSPTANPQSVTVAEDTATLITVTGTGAAQSAFTFAIGNQPAHGTLTGSGPIYTYTPASNYNGPDSFTFKVMQGTLSSGYATVSINTTATNDAPIATPQTVNTPQGIAKAITLTGTDPENNPLTFAIVSNPTPSGTLSSISGGNTVTYTPAAGFTGTATFTFRANDGSLNSAPATVTVIVGPPPANGTDVTLSSPNVSVALGGTTNIVATIHNNGPATATGVVASFAYPGTDLMRTAVTPTQGSCTTANPIVCTIGSMANGADVMVTIGVRAFNHGGTFTTNGSVSVTSLDYNTSNNAVVQTTTVTGSATAVADLAVSQTSAPDPVTFGTNTVYTIVVTNNGPSDATGISLVNTFTAATASYVSSTATQGSCANVANQVSCNVGSLINGASATYTVTLQASGSGSITNVATVSGSQGDVVPGNNTGTQATVIANRQPTALADVATVNEDQPAGVDVFVMSNDTDPDNDLLTVTSASGAAHGTVQVSNNGQSVNYQPAPDYFGSDSFSYTISDGRGGTASSTVAVSVLAVNDPPSFVKGANQSIGENAGAQTVTNWATSISAGPANEGTQHVSFVVSNNNHFLFSQQPAVSPTGTLTYTVATSGTGVATVTVTAVDDGGTANGGNDSSVSQTFTIAVAQTNDPPSFTKGADQNIDYNLGLQSVPNWATNISAGPPDENGQAVDFIVSNDNPVIFSQQPAVSPTGTLTYQTANGVGGSALVTVRLHDNGGTTPGVDTSAPQTFNINVVPTDNATFIVTNTNDSGNGSLRAAITNANAAGAEDTITFNIPTGSAPWTIQPSTALPAISDTVAIDGTSQPGYAGKPLVEIRGTGLPNGTTGLTIASDNSSIRGLSVTGFPNNGITLTANSATVEFNWIGFRPNETALGNGQMGVYVVNASNNLVKSNAIGAGGTAGVFVYGAANSNLIQNNQIGWGPSLETASPNGRGIVLEGSSVARPDGNTLSGNMIAGNTHAAIEMTCGTLCGASNTVIFANRIGLTGSDALLANGQGIVVLNGNGTNITTNVIAGGTDAISINEAAGVVAGGPISIVLNRIGTDATGTLVRPSGTAIVVSSTVAQIPVAIGGGGGANVIANNTGAGISVLGSGVKISGNSIYNNGGLGIDLGGDGVTANDSGDSDGGANGLQNYPVITSAIVNGASTTVTGTLNSTPNTLFAVDLFSSPAADPSGYGEGKTYLQSFSVGTDGFGNGSFTTSVTSAPGTYITATATDSNLNTSEFSQARLVVSNSPPTATNDAMTARSGVASTTSPNSNDTDPDVIAPSVLATYGPLSGAVNLAGPGDVAIVNATVGGDPALGYFTGGGLSTGTPAALAFLNPITNTITGTATLPVGGGSQLNKVNQSTRIVYMRIGNTLQAIDARTGSPTFNQSILAMQLGNIAAMTIDEVHKRLYATVQTNPAGQNGNGRFVAIDIDPSSGTFHQVVFEMSAPNSAAGQVALMGGVAVDVALNKIYVGVAGGPASGVNVFDGASFAVTTIPGSSNGTGSSANLNVVVNQTNHMVYATQGTSMFVIDGTAATVATTIALPASTSNGTIDTRMVVHSGTGRVYVRLAEFPSPSRLAVINPPPANSLLTTITGLGREDNQTSIALNEATDRLIVTSRSDLKSVVVDTTTNTVAGTFQATQPVVRVTLDAPHNVAYVSAQTGYIQAISLGAGGGSPVSPSLLAQIPTGVEITTGEVNPVAHEMYLPMTGATVSLSRIGATGFTGSVTGLPHGDGRALSVARNPATNKFYFVDANATAAGGSDALPGFVSVIDGSTHAVTATIPVNPLPFQGIAINELTNKIYVGGSFDGPAFPSGITVINGSDNTTTQVDISQIPSTNLNPNQVSFSRDFFVNTFTNKVYARITSGSLSQMAVINGATNVATAMSLSPTIGTVNIHRINPLLNRIYIGALDSAGVNQVHVFDGSNDSEITALTVGFPTTYSVIQQYLAVDRAHARLFAVNFQQGTLTAINANTNTVAATIQVGDGPSAVAVNETANRIYVANTVSRTLTIVDGATLRVTNTVPMPIGPHQLGVDETLNQVYVTGIVSEPGVVVVQDPLTSAPAITSVTQGAHGTVTLNADGTVTYTAAGNYTGSDSYTYTVSDGNGGTSTGTVNITVVAPLAITTATLPDSTVGSTYNGSITTTGGTGSRSYVVAAGLLPAGVILNNSTGALTGTVQQNGQFAFQITVRDSGNPPQQATSAYTVNVGPPTITTTSLGTATVATAFQAPVNVAAATGAVTWTLNTNGHPALAWLSINSSGVLQGTPTTVTAPIALPVTVTATDSLNQVASRTFSLAITAPLDVDPPREGIVLESQPALNITGGNGTKTASLTSGALPPGLSLQSTGSFSGSPTAHGAFTFTVQVQDCQIVNSTPTCLNTVTPQSVTRTFTMRVSAKDQQGSSSTFGSVSFGGPAGPATRRLAQVFTAGAHGQLTGVGLQNFSCSSGLTPVTIEIQRLAPGTMADGITHGELPNGVTIASGSTAVSGYYNAIAITPAIDVAIGDRLAAIVSAPLTCSFANTANTDQYNGGDAYAQNVQSGLWTPLSVSDGRYDLPSFRTLIQPSMPVTYLTASRSTGSATLLNNGKVLIAGGNTGTVAAELYDPSTNTAATTGSMLTQRTNATATLLNDGRVLIVGGRNSSGTRLASAEIYDPTTGAFTATGSLTTARENHRAVLLGDGRVLVTGGQDSSGNALSSAEIYSGSGFTGAGNNMFSPRYVHMAVLLQSGKVLVAGGYSTTSNKADIFDPSLNTFSQSTGNIASCRGLGTAVLLNNNKVLLAGGECGGVQASAELYDPSTNAFSNTGAMASPRQNASAVLLTDGSVLIAGGQDQANSLSYNLPLGSLERYDATSGTFSQAGSMETRRQSAAAVRLGNGKVFITNGSTQSWMSGNTAEVVDPLSVPVITTASLPAAPLGTPYSTTISAAGGTAPLTITMPAGSAPGLSFASGAPGVAALSGTPTAAGAFALTFQVTDAAGRVNRQTLTLTAGAGGTNTITSPFRLPNAALTQSYQYQLTATGASPVAWTVLPPNQTNLPPGLAMSNSGLITGTPTVLGNFNFAVRAVDANGVEAIKILGIFVASPLVINTTSLTDGILFQSYFPCINISNGVFPMTYSISAGSLPNGLSINNSGCFTGQIGALGNSSFTVQVTDTSSPPQTVTRPLSINVALINDQSSSWDSQQPAIAFGNGTQVAERVITGIAGSLSGARLYGSGICPAGTNVTVQLQGIAPNGGPDGTVLASGTAAYGPSFDYIPISPAIFFAADQQFTLVFSANNACAIRPSNFDSYPGEGYIGSSGSFNRIHDTDPRYDIGFQTLVQPESTTTFGYMKAYRSRPISTLLANGQPATNGKVLVLSDGTAELYDPSTNTFTTVAPPSTNRGAVPATLLDDGTVLITGGLQCIGNGCTPTYLASAELYHPDTNSWESLPNMTTARNSHTATRLANGKVLIAGGFNLTAGTLNSAEIYDPIAKTFTATGSMAGRHSLHSATLLNNGKVLIAGGGGSYSSSQSAELYDPSSGTFANANGAMLVQFRSRHTATLLADGKVLIAGGGGSAASTSGEVYDPAAASNAFSDAGHLSTPRDDGAAVLLADGSVLLSGGYNDSAGCCSPYQAMAGTERYVPGTGFVALGTLQAARYAHSATMLSNGKVLLAGGSGWSSSAGRLSEVYDPSTAVSFSSALNPDGFTTVNYSSLLQGQGGTGGYTFTLVSGSLPPGLTFDHIDTVSGTPTLRGTYPMAWKVQDSAGHSLTQNMTVTIDRLQILTANFNIGYANVAVSGWGLAASSPSVTWSIVSGGLPPGLSLTPSNGAITGTPSSTGFYGVTFRALDSAGAVAIKSFTIQINNALTITTATLVDGLAGNTYGGCINYNNGVSPFTWSLGGSVPPGLTMTSNNNCFDSLWPQNAIRQGGTYSFDVTVTDSSVPVQSKTGSYTVRFHAQDQNPPTQSPVANVPLPSTRRVAQVLEAGTSYGLSGVALWQFQQCTANTQITATAYRVTGMPMHPDEGAGALAQASVTADAGGFFNSTLMFASVVPMPQHALFSIVVQFTGGSCQGINWPQSNWYPQGSGWVNDNNGGWVMSEPAIGRPDIPIYSLSIPDQSLWFSPYWRSMPTSVKLNDGRVLIIGNEQQPEIFDPSAPIGQRLQLTGAMQTPRSSATATVMSNGNVLIAGGSRWDGAHTVGVSTTEIFDPSHNTFSAGPDLVIGRYGHVATRLANDNILITGGWTIDGSFTTQPIGAAWLLDPTGGLLASLGTSGARSSHTATLLNDGRVLVAGGWANYPSPATDSAEIYDPGIGQYGAFSPTTGSMQLWGAEHTASLITTGTNAGKVLIAGGTGNWPQLRAQGELFDPIAGTFTTVGGLNKPRTHAAAVTLPNGKIVIAGGSDDWTEPNRKTSTAEIYDPATGLFTAAGGMRVDRDVLGLEALSNTSVLASGGYSQNNMSGRSVELFNPSASALRIIPQNLPDGIANAGYGGATIAAAGGSGGNVFTISWGALPNGMSLDTNGFLSGTPTEGGVFAFVARVTDSSSAVAEQGFTLWINRLTIATNFLPSGVQNTSYSTTLSASGVGTVTWVLEPGSTLPGTLTLSSNGAISGTLGNAGNYFFSVRATDTVGQSQTRGYGLFVNGPMSINALSQQFVVAPEGITINLSTINNVGAVSWNLAGGSVPAGMIVDSPSHSITGTPSKPGLYSFTIGATDQAGPTPQTASLPGTLRAVAIGTQVNGGGGGSISIQTSQSLAQKMVSRANAPIVAVRAPVWCSSGSVTISINNVESGLPGATTLASQTFVSPIPYNQPLPFSSPATLPSGARFAVVFTTSGGNCGLDNPNPSDSYTPGAAYVNTGGGWFLLPGYLDLQVTTLVDAPGTHLFNIIRNYPRVAQAASDKVFVTGDHVIATLYDPNAISYTTSQNLGTFRQGGSATRLANGKILLAGGYDGSSVTTSAQLYDPATDTYAATGNMSTARRDHTATLLADGRVLIAGGLNGSFTHVVPTEIYDPGTGSFSFAGNILTVRTLHQATLLNNGKVLITGGGSDSGISPTYYDGELFTPSPSGPGTFTAVADNLEQQRLDHRDVKLPDGRVMITGGQITYPNTADKIEVYDSSCDCFTTVGTLAHPRTGHTASLVNGSVLIAGGSSVADGADPLTNIEMISGSGNTFTSRDAGHLKFARYGHAAIELCPGNGGCPQHDQLLFAGGRNLESQWSDGQSIETFNPADVLPLAAQGVAYSAHVSTNLGSPAYTIVAGSLPVGLSLGLNSGDLTGTPTQTGVFEIAIRILAPTGETDYRFLPIVVVP